MTVHHGMLHARKSFPSKLRLRYPTAAALAASHPLGFGQEAACLCISRA